MRDNDGFGFTLLDPSQIGTEEIVQIFRENVSNIAIKARRDGDTILLYLLSAAELAAEKEEWHLSNALSTLGQFRAMGKEAGDSMALIAATALTGFLFRLQEKEMIELKEEVEL